MYKILPFDSLMRSFQAVQVMEKVMIDDYIQRNLFENKKYQIPKKLNRHEHQVYSQNGEDGIIEEILNRIGTTNRYFVEFGVGDGLENNTAYLLTQDWAGYWIDGNPQYVKYIQEKFRWMVEKKSLIVKRAIVTAAEIENIFREGSVPEEFDVLSIDIDGNDYWIWKAIQGYHPRVVVIEYNALYPAHLQWIQKYDAGRKWDSTSYFGVSLKSLELLGVKKGYKLVGCNFTGVNAFFVRKDLVGDKFHEPFTAENHYEPPRYYLKRSVGQKRNFGEFVRN